MHSLRARFQARLGSLSTAARARFAARRTGIIAMIGLTCYLCCAATDPTGCKSSGSIGPSNGEVIGTAVAVGAVIVGGTVILVEVHNSHHTVKGCVFTGPGGLEVKTDKDMKIYAIEGDTAGVKVGDLVKFHGDKVKKTKDSPGNQTFRVQKINRDYGPCKLTPPATANAGGSIDNTKGD